MNYLAQVHAKGQLIDAAKGGQEQLVLQLLQNGVDVNTRDLWQRTALHWAAEHGHEGVCRLLIEKGVNIDIQAGAGWTALMCAAHSGHIEVVRLLLDRGANVHVQDYGNPKQTALGLATASGRAPIVELLKQNGASSGPVLQTPQAYTGLYSSFLQTPSIFSRPISAPPGLVPPILPPSSLPTMNYQPIFSTTSAAGPDRLQVLMAQSQAAIRSSQENRIRQRRMDDIHHKNFMNAMFPEQYPWHYSYEEF